MAGTRQRRVGRLRLKAPDESQARRGSIILEDAFRTATLPCAESGRLLVVRTLALGKFRSTQSAAGVALLIERRVGEVRAQAVHALDPRADSRPAVYFHDEAEGYVLLASLLARGEEAAAWFWPAAVPVWKRTLPREESLRTLLVAAVRSRAGAASASALLGELLARGGVESLLGSLRWTDGVELLRACGWSAPAPAQTHATPEVEETRPAGPHDALLARWASAWGHDDARTLWLGATLLIAEKPARLLDARLTSRAARLVERVTARVMLRGRDDAEATRPATQGQGSTTAERTRDSANVTDSSAPTSTHDTTVPGAREPYRSAGREQEEFPPLERDRAPRLEDTRDTRVANEGVIEHARARGLESDSREDEGEPHPTASHALGGVEGTTALDASKGNGSRRGATRAHELREATEDGASRTTDGDVPEGVGVEEAAVYHVPARTCCAGLFFLVPVMSHLGVAAFLEGNPQLIELDFPRRLLRYVCERLRVPADDPVVRALGGEARDDDAARDVGEFVTPESWRELYVPDSFRLARSRGRTEGLTPLLEAWTRAMRRWCRRRARIGLSELVRREGRLLATGTHVELFFDHGSADLRVRSAGLDLDPGWVAWLGRVVQFHYHNWGQEDGDF